jgi:hypothetical protein
VSSAVRWRLWRLSSARLACRELYRAGFAWTHPDKTQNTPCADRGRPDGTDKWRTESAIHVTVIGDPAGWRWQPAAARAAWHRDEPRYPASWRANEASRAGRVPGSRDVSSLASGPRRAPAPGSSSRAWATCWRESAGTSGRADREQGVITAAAARPAGFWHGNPCRIGNDR